MLEQGVRELGHLDVVVTNAGTMPMGTTNPMDATDVDLIGVMNTVAAAIPTLPTARQSSSPARMPG